MRCLKALTVTSEPLSVDKLDIHREIKSKKFYYINRTLRVQFK